MKLHWIYRTALLYWVFSLSGCAMVDTYNLATKPFELSEQKLLEIEQKPLPEDSTFDLALVNRAIAAMLLVDLPSLHATKQLAMTRAKQENTIIMIMNCDALTEAFSGHWRQAGLEFDEIETRLLATYVTHRGLYQAREGRSFLTSYLKYATKITDRKLGERLIATYFQPALKDQSINKSDRFLLLVAADNYRFEVQSFLGDPAGAYSARVAAMEGYELGPVKEMSKIGFTYSNWKRQKSEFHSLAGVDAVNAGLPDRAVVHLEILEKSATAKNPFVAMHIEQLKRSILWYMQDYETALENLSEFTAQYPILVNRIPETRTLYRGAKAQLLIALDRWEEAIEPLEHMEGAERVGDIEGGERGSLVYDWALGGITLAEAKLGRRPSRIKEFVAMAERYTGGRRGIQGSISYNGTSTIVFWEMASRSGSSQDLERAVASGRALGEDLRNNKYRTNNPTSALPAPVLELAKQAYAKAAMLGIPRHKADYSDLLNAMQMLQMSETDRDIAAMALRLSDIPGVSPGKLRQLQDLQRKVWATQNQILELALASDTKTADRARVEQETEAAIRDFNALLNQISQTEPRINQLLSSPKALGTRDIQRQLAVGEAFLAIAPLADSTLILLIEKGRARYHMANHGEAKISELVQRIRTTIIFDNSVTPPPFDMAASRELYEILLGWSDASLGRIRSLHVTTNGILGSVPFSLLLRKDTATDSLAYGRAAWLIKDMSITQIPTLSAWHSLSMSKSKSDSKGFIAWADPLYGTAPLTRSGQRGLVKVDAINNTVSDSALPAPIPLNLEYAVSALPETRYEAESIATILGASPKTDVISGSLATRSDVLRRSKQGELANKNVVMFATHGLSPGQLPGLRQPALVMAKENDAKQLLVLTDILGLKLSADWIILSACNTGSADSTGGDPLSGLARGFFFAGARGLLLTHWSVESESATVITTATMEEFAKDPIMGHGEALRKAVLRLVEAKDTELKWQHPAYWAPFVVVAGS